MSVYAPVPAYADRKRHPRALLFILAGHAAVIAAVMTARMDLPLPFVPAPTTVKLIPEPQVPPEAPPPQPKPDPRRSMIDQVPRVIPLPQPSLPAVDSLPLPLPNPGPSVTRDPAPVPALVRTGPRFMTPDSLLKPPYPQQKLRLEEEAVLRLRLSIDHRGRVTAVEPLGRADAIFLAAARSHLLAHWRYKPASEDGRPVASTTVVTLRFQLDE
jgi:protein TonB